MNDLVIRWLTDERKPSIATTTTRNSWMNSRVLSKGIWILNGEIALFHFFLIVQTFHFWHRQATRHCGELGSCMRVQCMCDELRSEKVILTSHDLGFVDKLLHDFLSRFYGTRNCYSNVKLCKITRSFYLISTCQYQTVPSPYQSG
jgi:hypothetical protein